MGDVLGERDFADHASALAWAHDEEELDDEVQRVEYLGLALGWCARGALARRVRVA